MKCSYKMLMFLWVISISLRSVRCFNRDDSFFERRWSTQIIQAHEDNQQNSAAEETAGSVKPLETQMLKYELQNTSNAEEATREQKFVTLDISPTKKPAEIDRNKRFFFQGFQNLFSFLIPLSNVPCAASSGDNGTCYKQAECDTLGGTGSGTCGNSGVGVCCVFIKSCGETTNQNVSYFVNSGYPNSFDSVGSCQLLVNKLNSSICQLRLDFIDMSLVGPGNDTVCNDDRFTVSSNSKIPTICGTNTGNHMYVNLGPGVSSPVTLSFVTMGASFQRKWKIKVSQIPCSTSYTAPSDCLQYFTGITGQIKTYNYDVSTGLQLANQDYTSCVRAETRFCGIQYTPCADTVNTDPQSFTMSGSGTPGSITGPTCTTDWVIIPCATNLATAGTGDCFDRFCGTLLNIANTGSSTAGNAAAYSFAKPFNIIYHTDGAEVTGELNNRGYCLNYVQQPCT